MAAAAAPAPPQPLDIQAVCWSGGDRCESPDDVDNEDAPKSYVIDVFGKTRAGDSVCVHVPFQPYLFVEVAKAWTPANASMLKEELRKKMRGRGFDKDVLHAKLLQRKKFYGFTNNEQFTFCCLVFKSHAACTYAGSILRKEGYPLYESNVDPILRLLHIRDLESSGWMRVHRYAAVPAAERFTHCDVEVVAAHQDIERLALDEVGPIVLASFDIECVSSDGAFPNPNAEGCPIIQIATCFQRYGEPEPFQRHIVCLGDTAPVDGVDMECFDDEVELLLAWARAVLRAKADVLIGYNIWGFDMEYVYQRAMHFGGVHNRRVAEFLHSVGRYRHAPTSLATMTLSSSAYGNNEWHTMRTPGILQVDLMQVVKKEYKLESYKLDAVAEHFVGHNKIDLPIPEMFRLYRGDAADRARIAEYCVRDTELPLKLVSKLAIIPNMVEMAKATHVPLEFLIPRGQQIKVFSQILKKTREKGYLCPTRPFVGKEDKYEGATVLDAKTGAHWGVITCLDFASLYPSIMRAHNMCHSTIVIDARYDGLPGVEYFEVDGVRFAQAGEGILPELLRDLATFRKKAKKDMAAAKDRGDKFSEMLYNGKQLAFKVSMNSMYGFCGAGTGFLPCVPLASSVTNVGRGMIASTRDLIEASYAGSTVVYGDTDSVMIDFGVDDLHACFRMGEEAAAMVTRTFKDPIELTFEKCYRPYLLFAKKRYAGLYYTNPERPDKLDCKGIQLVRRDNCRLVKRTLEKVLNIIMHDRDTDAAVAFVRQTAADLLGGRVDYQDLVLSKSLKASAACLLNQTRRRCGACGGETALKEGGEYLVCGRCGGREKLVYKNAMQPHIVVACKLEERSPGSGPNAAERVPYLYVDAHEAKKCQQASLHAEDVAYVLANGCPIDYMFYLEHQLMKPIVDLMSVILPDCEQRLFAGVGEDEYLAARSTVVRMKQNARNKQPEITDFFKPRAPAPA
jgi:DNA polymerase delta subunit 1